MSVGTTKEDIVKKIPLFLAVAVCVISTSVFPGVKINGSGVAYPTIQTAVDNTVDGDRLYVSTGEYAEAVLINNKDIIIEGGYFPDYATKTNDPSTTIVNGATFGSVFVVQSNSTVTFEYLNICSGAFFVGGGIRIGQVSTVTTRQCRIYGNGALGGGGVFVSSNSILVVTNTIINNNSALSGGGIAAESAGSRVILEGPLSQCYGNFADIGGGIFIYNSVELVVQGGADVYANIAVSSGGGIYMVEKANGIIRGNGTGIGGHVFAGNGATNHSVGLGGGIYVKDSTLTVAGPVCSVLGNYARNGGGGVYLTNSTLTVTDSGKIGWPDYWHANYTDGVGGGILALDSSVIVTNNAAVIYGIAKYAGGGIYSLQSDVNFYDATLGSTNAGASSTADVGGGLCSILSQLQFNNSRIIDNSANISGGGMFIVFSNDLSVINSEISGNIAGANQGGGICADTFLGSCVLDNTRVVSNVSYNAAGGIFWKSIDTLTVQNGSEICYNFASNHFGGVWMQTPGTLSFRDTDISHNTGLSGIGGIGSTGGGHIDCIDCNMNYNSGEVNTNNFSGALYLYSSTASLLAENRNCEIIGNRGVYGGGIEIDNGSILVISAPTSNTYTIGNNNSIYHGGGLYCEDTSSASVYGNTIFSGNTGVLGGGLCASNNCEMTLEPTNTFAPIISANIALLYGGGVATLYDTKFDAINCTFSNNTANNLGGGVFAFLNANINIDSDFSGPSSSILPRSLFINNNAGDWGGGILAFGISNSIIANSLFVSNSAALAGSAIGSMFSYASIENIIAVHNKGPDGAVNLQNNPEMSLYNCTIADNGPTGVASIATITVFPDMQNCIVWGHPVLQVTTNMDVQFCDIEGGYPGASNITNDPLFIAPGTLDYQLQLGSECIDNGATIVSITNDCIGNPRPMGLGYDIGAYELDQAPILNVIPLELDFGDVVVGDDFDLPVSVENLGNGPLNGNVINLMIPIFSVQSGSPYAVAPLSSNVVTFRFSPIVEVSNTNLVTFQSNGGNIDVTLIGTGIPEPCLFIIYYLSFIIYYRRKLKS